MKKLLFSIALSQILLLEVDAQFIQNKLTIGVGGVADKPISSKMEDDNLTTFGNYTFGIGQVFFVEYRIKNNIWTGIRFSKKDFSAINNLSIPITVSPASQFNTYALSIKYIPQIRIGNKLIEVGI